MPLYEIVTPYDSQDCNDCHTSTSTLFSKLATMVAGSQREQQEITVVRWESWDQREEMRGTDYEAPVLLDLDG